MGKAGIVIGILVVIVLFLGMGGCSSYGSIVRLDEAAKSQWAQVDSQLQRRYDLIPNIVETVKGYASHEKEVLENIANARTKYFSAPDDTSRAEAAAGVERALSRLLMLTETYPQLKANEGFLKLQDQLEGTENRIATERGRYNTSVKELNAYLRSPMGVIGNLFAQVKPREYFETTPEARTAPRVDFGAKPATQGG
jgi:LemA protein